MSEVVRKMTEDYDREHVSRLLPELVAVWDQGPLASLETWREAKQLGVTQALTEAYVAHLKKVVD